MINKRKTFGSAAKRLQHKYMKEWERQGLKTSLDCVEEVKRQAKK